MAEAAQVASQPPAQQVSRGQNSVMASTLISAHGLEHLYGRAFQAVIPSIYVDLGLVNYQAGLMDAVRSISSGITSMASGFFTDIFLHRRAAILGISMAMVGLGYLLVAISPVYLVLLLALLLPAAGAALWHPPALGLLAHRFPRHRGLMVSLHRSTGNVGDAIAPVVATALLGVVSWRWVLGGGTPMVLILALLIPVVLHYTGALTMHRDGHLRDIRSQFRSLQEAFKGGRAVGILPIFAVSALHGMGDRAFLWIVPLYLVQDLGKSYLVMGIHVALLQAGAIVAGPVLGALSDRIGRKPIIVAVLVLAAALPVAMVLSNGGIGFTIAVALFGLFAFSVNSLSQAAAIDMASGRGLEGTFIGLMWGVNAFFGAATAIGSGFLADAYGRETAFFLAAGFFGIAFLVSLFMPYTGMPRQQGRTA
ncbi:MAG: MFS transporter [SAR202 cluster bacterium]|nr:MFS transporter [SAR202 cluster bacterium]